MKIKWILVLFVTSFSIHDLIAEDHEKASSATPEQKLFQISASARIRGEMLRNKSLTTTNDDLRYMLGRFRLGLLFTPEENSHIFVQPQFSHGFGQTDLTNQSLTTVTTTSGGTESVPAASNTQSSGSTYDPALSIHQAYIEHAFLPQLEIKFGRQEFVYGDELVIGNLDWDNVARSFDALLARSNWGSHSIHAWAVKNIDRNIKANAEGDQDFYGIYSMWNIHEYLKAFDLYALFLRDPISTSPLKIYTGGIRAKSQIEKFDYRFETTLEKGRRSGRSMDAFQVNLEIGYVFPELQKLRTALEGFLSSKDYHQLYPTGHKWLGYLDLFGRRNIMGLAEHFHAEVFNATSIDVDLHEFLRQNTTSAAYKIDGTSALGTGTRTDSAYLGTELDITGGYQISKALSIKGGGSIFFPGQYLQSEVGDKNAMKTFIDLTAKY
jgi:hypothetical protein